MTRDEWTRAGISAISKWKQNVLETFPENKKNVLKIF